MEFNPPEIVKCFKRQYCYHQKQVESIDIALTAIESANKTRAKAPLKNGTKVNRIKKHRIQWTKEIDCFPDNYDELTIIDLQNDLFQKRVASAGTTQDRNVINNTLDRFEKMPRRLPVHQAVFSYLCGGFSNPGRC